MTKAGYDVAFSDLAVTPIEPVSLTSDVQRMQQAGVDFVVSCLSITNNVTLARDLHQYGLRPAQLWFNGADQTVVKKYQSLLQGVYFSVGNVPESAATVDPGTYPGLATYLKTMNRYAPGYAGNALALDGWEAAALLVAGIKAAGKHLTQTAVVAATNKMTAFTAGGVQEPVDWVTSHTTPTVVACTAYEQVRGAQVLPALGKGKQVFVCFTVAKVKDPQPVAPPKGMPGPAG
jgi:ABC-type branched-subunit amino acid transport system substrate-binding protein